MVLTFTCSFRWEYIWCVSVILSFIGLSAARSNNVVNMQKYMIGVVVFGILPVLYCFLQYMSDVSAYMKLDEGSDLEDTDIVVWQVSSRTPHFKSSSLTGQTFLSFLESSIRLALVRLRICCPSNPHFFASVRVEPDQCMEVARHKKEPISLRALFVCLI